MNPDPEQSDINLTILLGEEPFNEKYKDYISGTINTDIPNENPVIFTDSLKILFSKMFTWIFKVGKRIEMHDIVMFNTIDMWYRVFHTIKDVNEVIEQTNLMCVCFLISSKAYNINVPVTDLAYICQTNVGEMLKTERKIVEILGGILDRDLPIFYGISFDKFNKWIIGNPEKYEQFNMTGLLG